MKQFQFIFFLLIFVFARAQQDPLLTQFWNISTSFNPATTGLSYKHQAGINYRNQWEKINGAPNTLFTTYNARIDKYKSGIGINYMYETIGELKQHRFDLNYSYHVDLGNEKKLAFGASVGFRELSFIPNYITELSPSQGFGFLSNFGIAYKTKNFNIGLSSTQINEAKIKEVGFSYSRHYFFNASYDFNLTNNFTLKPQVLLRTDGVFMSTDINLLAIFQKQYWIGVTSRSRNTFSFMGGIDLKEKYRIGYNYDITYSRLNNGVSSGSHEIVLGFLLK